MKQTIIVHSHLGKPLVVKFIGDKSSSLKILIIAGQHGDEKYSKKAVSKLADHYVTKRNLPFYAAILDNANPDGGQNNSRFNAQSIDLNRDHLLLQSNETEAIHNFVRKWNPKIVIDVHNYPSRRRHLLKKKLILNQDIFIDFPTNLAVIQTLSDKKINEFISKVKKDLTSLGFSCERYVIFKKSGKIRHSTLDVKDARNSLALRYGVFSIILEGKEPLKKEGIAGQNRTIMSQFYALQSVIDFMAKNKHEFASNPHVSIKGELVPIRFKYRNSNEIIELEIKNSKTKKTKKRKFKNYSPHVDISKFIEMPSAYGVPNSATKLLKLIQKHGFSSSGNLKHKGYYVYYYKTSPKSSLKQLKKKLHSDNFSNYTVFPTNQIGGRFLALLLEPQSKFGLHRFSALKLTYPKNLEYPIIRI